MHIIGKNTKIDISGHKATVMRVSKEGVVCQLDGKEKREFVVGFDTIETALNQGDNDVDSDRSKGKH
jgi:hypothetical protein